MQVAGEVGETARFSIDGRSPVAPRAEQGAYCGLKFRVMEVSMSVGAPFT